jgi:uncharacterized protein (DUF58 family)
MAEESGQRARLTPLLSNDVLDRLRRLRINPHRRLTNRRRGEHLTGRGGSSIEFSAYRDYVPGDDVRFVDWNIFARLNRPYLKLYEQEEEVHIVLLVDGSDSMLFEGKFLRARQLAAAFGVLALLGTERLSAYSFNRRDGTVDRLPPCRGRASMRKLFRFLEDLEGGGSEPVEEGVESFLRFHSGRGVAILLSDFLTFGDVRRALNRVFSVGLEVFGVQILSPAEIDPEVGGDVRLVDAETDTTLDVSSAGDLLDIYQEQRGAHEAYLAELCRQRNGRFLSLSSRAPLDWLLFDLMVRRGWLV